MNNAKVIVGNAVDVLRTLDSGLARTCVTSPPYWGLRDYGQEAQLGLEDSPEAFIENLCLVFDEVWRVLADDGTLWVNMGDSYAGSGKGRNADGSHQPGGKQGTNAGTIVGKLSKTDAGIPAKNLVGIPWMFAFAMRTRGWYLRQDIIWSKPNPMPESVKDRCTKSHEYIFLFSKQPSYYYDHEAIKEDISEKNKTHYKKYASLSSKSESKTNQVRDDGGFDATHCGFSTSDTEKKNKRSVWSVSTQPYAGAHFAVYPPKLILPCILAGSAPGDTVLDPFSGSGTTGMVALQNDRNYVGIELNPDYAALSEKRISVAVGMLGNVTVQNPTLRNVGETPH